MREVDEDKRLDDKKRKFAADIERLQAAKGESVTDNDNNHDTCVNTRNTKYLESYYLSGIRGTHCGGCGKPFGNNEQVFRASIPARWLGIYITDMGLLCEGCAAIKSENMHGVFKPFGKCGICGRVVHMSTESPVRNLRRVRVYCCENHRQQMYRPEKKPAQTTCQTCAGTFTPKRTDSKYCSSKCRQKAYRQRIK